MKSWQNTESLVRHRVLLLDSFLKVLRKLVIVATFVEIHEGCHVARVSGLSQLHKSSLLTVREVFLAEVRKFTFTATDDTVQQSDRVLSFLESCKDLDEFGCQVLDDHVLENEESVRSHSCFQSLILKNFIDLLHCQFVTLAFLGSGRCRI